MCGFGVEDGESIGWEGTVSVDQALLPNDHPLFHPFFFSRVHAFARSGQSTGAGSFPCDLCQGTLPGVLKAVQTPQLASLGPQRAWGMLLDTLGLPRCSFPKCALKKISCKESNCGCCLLATCPDDKRKLGYPAGPQVFTSSPKSCRCAAYYL